MRTAESETEIARREATRRAERRRRAKSVLTRKGEGGREGIATIARESDGDGRGEKDNRRGRVRSERGGTTDTSRATKSKPRRWDQGGGTVGTEDEAKSARCVHTGAPRRVNKRASRRAVMRIRVRTLRAYVCARVCARVSSPPTGAALLLRRVLLLLREARMKGGDGRGGAAAEGG